MTTMPRETRLDAYDPSGRDDSRNWHDTGCRLHPSCLNCPRPVCVYDEKARQGGRLPLLRTVPDLEGLVKSIGAQAVGEMYGIHPRTVWRELARRKKV